MGLGVGVTAAAGGRALGCGGGGKGVGKTGGVAAGPAWLAAGDDSRPGDVQADRSNRTRIRFRQWRIDFLGGGFGGGRSGLGVAAAVQPDDAAERLFVLPKVRTIQESCFIYDLTW